MEASTERWVRILTTAALVGGVAWMLLRRLDPPVVRFRRPAPRGRDAGGEPPAVGSARPCAATTRAGGPCRRDALPGSPFCWQHRERS